LEVKSVASHQNRRASVEEEEVLELLLRIPMALEVAPLYLEEVEVWEEALLWASER
jgi:hypothetical protein